MPCLEVDDLDKKIINALLLGDSVERLSIEMGFSPSWGRTRLFHLRARLNLPSNEAIIAKLAVRGKIKEENGTCMMTTN